MFSQAQNETVAPRKRIRATHVDLTHMMRTKKIDEKEKLLFVRHTSRQTIPNKTRVFVEPLKLCNGAPVPGMTHSRGK